MSLPTVLLLVPSKTIGPTDMSGFATWTIDDLPGFEGVPAVNPVPLDAAPRDDGGVVVDPGTAAAPVGGRRGGAGGGGGAGASAASGSAMMAFDIRSVSQADAQAALERVTRSDAPPAVVPRATAPRARLGGHVVPAAVAARGKAGAHAVIAPPPAVAAAPAKAASDASAHVPSAAEAPSAPAEQAHDAAAAPADAGLVEENFH
jgi:hypothetical protein